MEEVLTRRETFPQMSAGSRFCPVKRTMKLTHILTCTARECEAGGGKLGLFGAASDLFVCNMLKWGLQMGFLYENHMGPR